MGVTKFAKLTVGVASAMAIATSAYAADAVVYEQPPEPVIIEPGFTWTGLYIGANVGYSWGDFDHTATLDPIDLGFVILPGFSFTDSANADGITAGGQIGYNWQANNLVFGVEADIQAANLEGGFTRTEYRNVVDVTSSVSTELDWFGTVRGRLGFVPTERLMVYGTGGLAYGRTTSSASLLVDSIVDFGGSTSDSKTRVGWTAGAGAEYAFTDHWSFKGEYLYTDLGVEDFFNFSDGPVNFTLNSDVKFHTVRVGVNYKF